jgi:hypothetical protein
VHDVVVCQRVPESWYQVTVIPNQGKGAAMARVEQARNLFSRIWFNEDTTGPGRDALGWYHEKRDQERNVGLGPEHDWSSHGADAFGLMCVAYEEPQSSAPLKYPSSRQLEHRKASLRSDPMTMATITNGSNATVSLNPGDIITIEPQEKATVKYENPTGTLERQFNDKRTFGPYKTGRSVKITSVIGTVYYEVGSARAMGSLTLAQDPDVSVSWGTGAPAALRARARSIFA